MTCTRDTVKENGLNIWSLPEAGCTSEVDIIAVQGLGAHPFYSWVRKVPRVVNPMLRKRRRRWQLWSRKRISRGDKGDQEVMWLRDLLPSELKNARIATYSYQSDWRDPGVETTLRQCSEQFLNIIYQNRRCDEALNIADHGDDYADIRLSVAGIIFLGAPFRGSDLAVYGKWIAKVSGRDTTLLRLLQKDNSYLHGLSRDFWASYGNRDVLCFYESKDAEYGPWKQRIVDVQSASIHGKRMIYMNTDHSGLNKFSGVNDENYMLLLPEIQRMVKSAPSAISGRQGTIVPTRSATQHDQVNQKRHWVVPFGRNKQFVGREPTLGKILAKIPPSVEEDNCQRTAIEGLGGIGKTQIALEAAFRVRDMHQDCSIFWVPAVDVASFENAYRKIGHALEVKGIDADDADVKLLVKDALNRESTGKWLLIIDNADDIDLFSGNASLSNYLPSSYKGSVLFTTRDHKATVELSATSIPIKKLERNESHMVLRTSLEKDQLHNTEDTTKLLDFLEDLPLAIKQASTYMAKEAVSTTEYLKFCQSNEADVANLLSEDFSDLYRYEKIPNPVVKTFRISFEKISIRDPLAAEYLRFISFLAEKDIPRPLLPPAGDLETTKAIGTLKGYAFITEREEGNAYDIHRLVRLSMLNWLANTGARQEWATKAFRRLSDVFPSSYMKNRTIVMRYLPHAKNLTKFLEDTSDIATEYMLLRKLGVILDCLARYGEAEDMFRKALELGKRMQGKIALERPVVMRSLGKALYHQERYEEAEKILQEAVALWQAPDKTDPLAVKTMRLLANTLNRQEKFGEAEDMHWQALDLMKETLNKEGPDHSPPNNSHHDNNHSRTYTSNENINAGTLFYEEAEDLYRQARQEGGWLGAEILKLMISFAHMMLDQSRNEETERFVRQLLPLLRMSQYNKRIISMVGIIMLETSLHRQGKPRSKIEIETFREALILTREVLSETHLNVLAIMRALGLALHERGDIEEAVKVLREAFDLHLKVLGEEDRRTLEAMYSFGSALLRQGNMEEAVKILRQALKKHQQVLGEEDFRTLRAMHDLGIALCQQDDIEEAVKILRKAFDLHLKVLGKEDRRTLEVIHCLGSMLLQQGNIEEAVQILRKALDLHLKVLSREDHRTLETMYCLGSALRKQGNMEEAVKVLRQALNQHQQVFGTEDFGTLRTMHGLGIALYLQGNSKEAMVMFRLALGPMEKVLGEEHPIALDSKKWIKVILENENSGMED
ncbi:hypothetical protein ANO14919_106790 [Xylariales sp. No.14919]|nr:hypothetical protein ANO14919_106790 [Xylariales sp. No.14919]